jgi:hypothetical protein
MPEVDESSIVVAALGSTVRIRWVGGVSADALAHARRAWSRCQVDDDHPDLEVTAAVQGELSEEDEAEVNALGQDDTETLEVATAGVTVLAIQELAGDRLMLHACAVADPDSGAAVVMVGPSGAGKTTIAATHGRRWGYVTDETVAVDRDGRAWSYPKPLSVVDGERKVQHSPDDLGLVQAPVEVTVAKVLLLDRRPGVAAATVEPVQTADAIALLAEHTSYLTYLDRPLHWLGGLVQQSGGVDRVSYGECEQLEPLIEGILRGAR